ncbi:MAG: hypothetical protein II863_14990 [Kiritimatiellae bacterium]|nr:hypothetical protein [Kiritimatiellia bacterium]
MKFLLSTVMVVFGLQLVAERQPFERYQSILDRQMFGQPPAGFDPTKPPAEVSRSDRGSEAEQATKEQIRSAIRFSAINVTPNGETAVGFTDSSNAKNPVHYYLKVGESRNGWLVKEADPVKATMTIVKDEIEVTLPIGGNSASGGKGAAAAGAVPTPPGGGLLMRRASEGNAPPSAALGSLRSRRLAREQQRAKEAAENAERQAAENAKREEERRRDEEEKAQRAAEREEQRAQLLQIQEELRKAREARAAREAEESAASDAEGE